MLTTELDGMREGDVVVIPQIPAASRSSLRTKGRIEDPCFGRMTGISQAERTGRQGVSTNLPATGSNRNSVPFGLRMTSLPSRTAVIVSGPPFVGGGT